MRLARRRPRQPHQATQEDRKINRGVGRLNRKEFLQVAGLFGLASLIPYTQSQGFFSTNERTLPNVLILVLDALSARHMTLHGYSRNTTPNLARLAERSLVYHRHYAAGNFTTPGLASMLTGVYPWSHRAFNTYGLVSQDYMERNVFSLLSSEVYSSAYSHNLLTNLLLHQFRSDIDQYITPRNLALADLQYSDILFGKDYNVSFLAEASILKEPYPVVGSLYSGLIYQLYQQYLAMNLARNLGGKFPFEIPNENQVFYMLEPLIEWVMDQVHTMPQPFLAYYHFLPPHDPYLPPRDFYDCFKDDGYRMVEKPPRFSTGSFSDQTLALANRRYDEYLAYADREVGRLCDFLEKTGIFENTYLIFTSDHGDLFERGEIGHITRLLYEGIIRVPLLIVQPGQKERVDILDVTSNVDLLPTILRLFDQPIPDWCEGQILPGIKGAKPSPGRVVYTVEAKQNHKYAPITIGTLAARTENLKLIQYFGYPDIALEYELYDIDNDPEELNNLVESQPTVARDLQKLLQQKLDEVNQPYLQSN